MAETDSPHYKPPKTPRRFGSVQRQSFNAYGRSPFNSGMSAENALDEVKATVQELTERYPDTHHLRWEILSKIRQAGADQSWRLSHRRAQKRLSLVTGTGFVRH